jgi:Zn-finger protein
MGRYDIRPCPCGSGEPSRWQYDARGIELCRTCKVCHKEKMKGYTTDVLTNSNYQVDEPIEPEDYY